MKHLFSSGESMYGKNCRKLPEGILAGKYLEYDEFEPDTRFYCEGVLNDREVRVSFMLTKEGFDEVKIRKNLGILMQSDVFQAEWAGYEIHERT